MITNVKTRRRAPTSTFAETFLNRTSRLLERHALDQLRTRCLLVAGCGGVGAAVALTMARLGVGRFVLADPGSFDEPDVNRQWGADGSTLGKNKAIVYRDWLRRVNPTAEIATHPQGVTWDNVADLVAGADVIIDCLDISVEPPLRTELFKQAAAAGAYSVTAPVLGFGTLIAIAAPDGMSMAAMGKLVSEAALTGRLPAFIHDFYAPATVAALERDLQTGRLPSLSIGPVLAGALVSTEVLQILLQGHSEVWRAPVCLPRVILADAFTGRQHIASLPELIAPVVTPPTAVREIDRMAILHSAGFNTDLLRPEHITVDLRTDSWAEINAPPVWVPPATASAEERFSKLYGLPHVLAVTRGRAAEAVMALTLVRPGEVVAGNGLFPTARMHIASRGATLVDISQSAGENEDADMDYRRLQVLMTGQAQRISCVWVEACANASGGAGLTLANLQATHALCQAARVPLILDATRLLDNVILSASSQCSHELLLAFTRHCDMLVMSATKDFPVLAGGFLAAHDGELCAALADQVLACGCALPSELNPALAAAMTADPFPTVRKRVALVRKLHDQLTAIGVPILHPVGGHAVVVDAGRLLSHLTLEQFPAMALANALYLQAGVRGGEHFASERHRQHGRTLLRLAIPVSRYSNEIVSAVGDALAAIRKAPHRICGLRMVRQEDGIIGRMRAQYEPTDA